MKGGISPVAPRPPKGTLQSLPPILRIIEPSPTAGYSKAPRGLFVLPRVGRIFTASSISPSPSLRQRSSRYAIRAGRNLPDKEFRYLRHSCYSTPKSLRRGHFCSATLCMSPCRSDHIILLEGRSGVWPLRIPLLPEQEWSFLLIVRTPTDCHLRHAKYWRYSDVPAYSQIYNGHFGRLVAPVAVHRYSYGRH